MSNGHSILNRFLKRWLILLTVESLAFGFLVMMISGALAYYFNMDSKEWLAAIFFILGGFTWSFYKNVHKINLHQIAVYLDNHDSVLENSATLILKPIEGNSLEEIQRDKLECFLVERYKLWKTPVSPFRTFLFILFGVFFGWFSYYLSLQKVDFNGVILNPIEENLLSSISTNKPIELKEASVLVKAPKYTGLNAKSYRVQDLEILENSSIKWKLIVSKPTENVILIFQTQDSIILRSDGNNYQYSKVISSAIFYQIMIKNGNQFWLSDFYTLSVIKDQAPQIEITGLADNVQYDLSKQQKVPFAVKISDDYGVSDAYMVATVSKGDGESVKFREERLDFNYNFNSSMVDNLVYEIDFEALKMENGDELYFYIVASDNCEPKANTIRSDMYFLSLLDTTKLATFIEGGLAVDLMPEYFRSQRQIIIDTEELLKEKKNLAPKLFKARSNGLANDQKILRLRYGQFLGEEFESGIGPNALDNLKSYYLSLNDSSNSSTDQELKSKVSKMFGLQISDDHYVGDGHNHDEEALKEFDKVGNDSNPEMSGQQEALELLQPYIHAHDEAEEATFFDEALKAKLKAALAQMWEAELRLRLYQPQDALPFEYKALTLIKEIQQQSRIYVERVGFEAPPLKEDKRLSGKWQIINSQNIVETIHENESLKPIERTIDWINQQLLLENPLSQPLDLEMIKMIGKFLVQLAINEPGKDYMKALRVIKMLEDKSLTSFQKMESLKILRIYLNRILGPASHQVNFGEHTQMQIREKYLNSLKKP